MALVFKIKFQNTLRRWVVTERPDEAANLPSLQQLEAKIRDLFQLSPTTAFVLTYIDQEEDVVTVAEDQDLVDACIAQRLNPLRLDVKVLGESQNAPASQPSVESPLDVNIEALLKSISPQATADAVKQLLSKIPQVDPNYPQATADAVKQLLSKLSLVDPKVPVALLVRNVQESVNDFLKNLKREGGGASREAGRNCSETPHERPHPDQSDSQRFPCRGGRGASAGVLHRGVECDGCGKSPIEGPRFTSKKVVDYDLCSSCFEKMGNEADYEKIDHPVHPWHNGFYSHPQCGRARRQHMGPPPFRPVFARGPYGWKPECPVRLPPGNTFPPAAAGGKLDARFVKDVTIFDGTELAPRTKFTKIWRLSNIGTIPWPQNTQLVHIGGDMLTSEEAVHLELPEGGLPCGEEVEVSVDLVAPEKAGRYVSHWRLMSPLGQKFGHRVWVVIQVVPQDEQSPQLYESLRGEDSTQEPEPQADIAPEKGNEEYTSDPKKGKDKVVSLQRREAMVPVAVVFDHAKSVDVEIPEIASKEVNAQITEPTLDRSADQTRVREVLPDQQGSKMENGDELDGFSVVEKPVETMEWEGVTDSKTDLEKHLQLLEGMGYMDRELNVDLLQKNNQNLELTVEDLVATAGWDDLLKDLQEMGFNDRQTNRGLLIKNQGSIKRVVKELVQMEKKRKVRQSF